jgi:cell division protein FtsQ
MAIAAQVDRALLLRRRALKRAEGRRRLTLVCVAAGVLVAPPGYWILEHSSAFSISSVAVGGAGPRMDARIQAAAQAVVGHESLLQVDAGTVARAIDRLPYVRSAQVDRRFPHTLAVRVRLYRAVALLRSGTVGYLIADDGRILGMPTTPPKHLPVVEIPTGLVLAAGQRAGGADVDAGLAVLAQAMPPRLGRVHRVISAPTAGLIAILNGGLQVRLGATTGLELKLRVAARAVRRMPRSTRIRLAYVDVSVPARPALGYKHSTSSGG